ncbi:MAG: PhzF family phenazine biosynthesis protein [Bacteroidales bacterium]|jgi:PhzF family phenazine biosynthesis protein|nr:PhzF family phenazine biosynthesis protein [Bacteroidales bacterium]MDD3385832.1 PhzF family phenazine biosynthesis protein [Bacteroidales bacterium]MDD3811788.1 PhzF family phenazine biosynthesis protein [Bacteroidales bacterium]MDD3871587.1 PhzF family phenazine biosynthesis protein [Bacteroidales bacterium]MDD4813381.1 PhzF family phenazine biosynthesis protein [Bacteroidales bacterium]
MSKLYPIYQVDAFASRLFSGNPAAVVPMDEWPDDEVLQRIATENNLSETAFFIPAGDHFHLRWFTPTVEVDLCGHATLATAHVLFKEREWPADQLLFESRSGMLRVYRESGRYILDFPFDEAEPVEAPKGLIESIGKEPLYVYRGKTDYLLIYDKQSDIERLKPDFQALSKVEARGVIVSAPGEWVDFVSRFFCPQVGIHEDPVTGSAHTTLTPYWSRQLAKQELTARQLSERGGDLICRNRGNRIEIAGEAVTYLRGEIQT